MHSSLETLVIIEWHFKYIVMLTMGAGCSSAAWRRVWENDGDVTRAKPLCCVVAVSLEPPSAERVRQSVEFSSPGPGLLPSCCAWALPNPRTTALPHLPIITASQIIHNIIQSTLCHRNPSRQRGETTERQDFASHCLQDFPFPQALGGNTSSAKTDFATLLISPLRPLHSVCYSVWWHKMWSHSTHPVWPISTLQPLNSCDDPVPHQGKQSFRVLKEF